MCVCVLCGCVGDQHDGDGDGGGGGGASDMRPIIVWLSDVWNHVNRFVIAHCSRFHHADVTIGLCDVTSSLVTGARDVEKLGLVLFEKFNRLKM